MINTKMEEPMQIATLERTMCILITIVSFHYLTARDLIQFGYFSDISAGIIPSILFIFAYYFCSRFFFLHLSNNLIYLFCPHLSPPELKKVYTASLRGFIPLFLITAGFLIVQITLIRIGAVTTSLTKLYFETHIIVLILFLASYIYIYYGLRIHIRPAYRITAPVVMLLGILLVQLIAEILGYALMFAYSILGMIVGGGDW